MQNFKGNKYKISIRIFKLTIPSLFFLTSLLWLIWRILDIYAAAVAATSFLSFLAILTGNKTFFLIVRIKFFFPKTQQYKLVVKSPSLHTLSYIRVVHALPSFLQAGKQTNPTVLVLRNFFLKFDHWPTTNIFKK